MNRLSFLFILLAVVRSAEGASVELCEYERLVIRTITAGELQLKVLSERAADGDRDAVDRMFRILTPHITGQVALRVRKVQIADNIDDISQRVMMNILRNRRAYDPTKGAISSWVRPIVMSEVDHYFQTDRRRAARNPGRTIEDLTSAEDLISPEPPVGSRIEQAEERERIKKQIEALPTNMRTAIEMHYFEQLTVQEISARLGVPDGTVKTWLSRGRQLLRKELEAEAGN